MKRLVVVLVTVGSLGIAACGNGANSSVADGGADTGINNGLGVTPGHARLLDMVFLIDNSPGSAGDVNRMMAALPNMFAAMKDSATGEFPDLRIAFIDSDLGTGGAYTSGACGPKNGSPYGDGGRFQMRRASECGVISPDALFLEYKAGAPLNYTGDLSQVMSCLSSNLDLDWGCGFEHTLQAFEFALVAKGIGNDEQQAAFLRPNANLALFFVTDEDDCSAATNDGIFGGKPELAGESASLRCATRAHACGGMNLADGVPGYPTTSVFQAPFATCEARTDDCPNALEGAPATDTSVPTKCSPLRSVKRIADQLKSLKAASGKQVLVAGIFGWPATPDDEESAVYRIDMAPNPNPQDLAHPKVFDLWPVCYHPDHLPAGDGNGNDIQAAGSGAQPGLRLAAFVREFGNNGLKFSLCQRSLVDTMAKIGQAFAASLD